MLGRHEETNVRWFQRALEEFDDSSVLEFKVASEGGFANGTGGIDAGEEANLVIGFGGVPFAEAVNVDVACVSL
jgi:hypothetical protein